MPSAGSPLLQLVGFVGLAKHQGSGGFGHAAAHASSGHVYVAHTANSAGDVFDPTSRRHLFSVPQLPGVAGVLVSEEAQLIIAATGPRTRSYFLLVPIRRCQRSPSASVQTVSPTVTTSDRFLSPMSAFPPSEVRTPYPSSASMIAQCGRRSPCPVEHDGRSIILMRRHFT